MRFRHILIGLITALLMPLALHAEEPVPDHGVILMYHRFGSDRHPSTNIRLDQFEAHLQHLEDNGYRVWPLEKLVRHLTTGTPIPDRVVAITMDDAYRSIYTEAYPRLRARGWPFTVFVSTDGVDQHYRTFLDWDQIREMAKNGGTFANHSASHTHLVDRKAGETTSAWRARTRADIEQAQQRLVDEVGHAPMLLAYPYGEYNPALLTLIGQMGYTAFGQHSGPAGMYSNPAALPRFPMSERYGKLPDFRVKVASLPFPIRHITPLSPVLGNVDSAPRLTITLHATHARLERLNCFASGMGTATVTWDSREDLRFSVTAERPPTSRRSRYNCTAPSPLSGRYYWYSHPWLRLPPTGG